MRYLSDDFDGVVGGGRWIGFGWWFIFIGRGFGGEGREVI